jgi:hypothetical protein
MAWTTKTTMTMACSRDHDESDAADADRPVSTECVFACATPVLA